jgi:hypothetical protein
MKAPEMYEDEIERYCRYRKVRLGEIFSGINYSGAGHPILHPRCLTLSGI